MCIKYYNDEKTLLNLGGSDLSLLTHTPYTSLYVTQHNTVFQVNQDHLVKSSAQVRTATFALLR